MLFFLAELSKPGENEWLVLFQISKSSQTFLKEVQILFQMAFKYASDMCYILAGCCRQCVLNQWVTILPYSGRKWSLGKLRNEMCGGNSTHIITWIHWHSATFSIRSTQQSSFDFQSRIKVVIFENHPNTWLGYLTYQKKFKSICNQKPEHTMTSTLEYANS